MNDNHTQIKALIYDKCAFKITGFKIEKESRAYGACRFDLDGMNIISRNAKTTAKKIGQFVTLWKRIKNGPIRPFNEEDNIDFCVVNVRMENRFGQFVFPKTTLIKKGVISTSKKEGKRAFRVYPIWDITTNKQAERTQKWQLDYFYEINGSLDFEAVTPLFQKEEK